MASPSSRRAMTAERWPWPGLAAPVRHPEHVVRDSDPERVLDKLCAANQGRDVHLVGGPRTIETFRALGALDKLGLIVLSLLFGAGMQLTPTFNPDTELTVESSGPARADRSRSSTRSSRARAGAPRSEARRASARARRRSR